MSVFAPMLRRWNGTRARIRTTACTAATFLLIWNPDTSGAVSLDRAVTFRIAAQPLDSALLEFSRQADVPLAIDATSLTRIQARDLSGNMTASTALTKLLDETGLSYRTVGNTVTVTRIAAAGNRTSTRVSSVDGTGGAANQTAGTETNTATPTSDVGSSKPALEEVIVTSQRRSENLERVPISLTAFSQRAMDDLHIQSLSDLASVVPGLVVTTPGFLPNGGNVQSWSDVAIRGIFSGGNAPTTGIYIDETPVSIRRMDSAGFAGSPQPDIFDLERVEVLRGPQGTLFGASAMGGAIRYITPQPSLTSTSGYAKAEAGYTDHGTGSYAAGLAYGAPIVEGRVGMRVSGWFHSDGGFIEEVDPYTGAPLRSNANGSKTYVLRPAFTIAPLEHLTITPAAFIQHEHSDASSQYWLTNLPVPATDKHLSGMGRAPTGLTDDLKIYSLAVKYDFAKVSLQSDTSYLGRNFHAFDDWTGTQPYQLGGPAVIPGLSSWAPYDQNVGSNRVWQQELRLTSAAESRLTWVVGAYYRHSITTLSELISDVDPGTLALFGATAEEFFGVPQFPLNGQMLSSYTNFSTTDEQTAGFGEVGFAFTSKLKATVGVRVEHSVVKDQHQTLAGPFNGTAFATHTVPDEKDNPVTPRVGITYQLTDATMVYTTASKGYRAGGSNTSAIAANPLCGVSVEALGLPSVPPTYNPDGLWSYEIGAKASVLERRLAFQASAFFIDWTGIQTAVYLPSCAQYLTLNQGRAISKGFDFQFDAVPFEGLEVGGNVGYINAYYPDGLYGVPVNGVRPIVHAAGDKLPGAVPWTAAAHVEYSWRAGSSGNTKPYVRLDYRWLDRISNANPLAANTNVTLGPTLSDAYDILNVHFGLVHEGLDLSVFVNNATNSDPRLGYAGFGVYSASAIRPLTAGLTALYRF